MNIQTIPLSKLVPSPANVRKMTASGIEQLAASIEAHGLLQNLQVKVAAKGNFEVVAGGRRLAALKLMAKAKKIEADYPVPCHVRDGDDATEISLAENEMRLGMHPADQFEAFKALVDQGHGAEEIAARFGVTPQVVRQRLKLAVVSPKLIALYRKGDLTLDCLMAFTVSDDAKQQEKVWKALPEWGRNDPDSIRDALTEAHVAADGKLAQFVGLTAYEKAGGPVLRDLFDEEGAGWLTDPALLKRLASEKLETEAAAIRAEGWKWVEIVPDHAWETTKEFGKIAPALTAAQQAEAEALEAKLEAMNGDEDDYDALWERHNGIAGDWTAEAKATAGAMISIAHDGAVEIRRGLVRPDDKAAARKADPAKAAKAEATDAPCPGLSAALLEDLTAQRTAALQARLAENPKVALAAVTHALAVNLFYHRGASALEITPRVVYLDRSAEGIADSKAAKQLEATTKAIRKRLPKQDGKLWAWLLEQDQKTLLGILAVCAAHTVDAVVKKRGSHEAPSDMSHAGQLAEALKLDMADYWQPTAASYFGRVSKALVLEAVAEGASKEAAANIATLKKDALADRAGKLLSGTGWLPAPLRAA